MVYSSPVIAKLLSIYGSFYKPDVSFFKPEQHSDQIFFQFISRKSLPKAAIYSKDLKLY